MPGCTLNRQAYPAPHDSPQHGDSNVDMDRCKAHQGAGSEASLIDVASCVGFTTTGLVPRQACVVRVPTEAGVVGLACPVQVAWLCMVTTSHVITPVPC